MKVDISVYGKKVGSVEGVANPVEALIEFFMTAMMMNEADGEKGEDDA